MNSVSSPFRFRPGLVLLPLLACLAAPQAAGAPSGVSVSPRMRQLQSTGNPAGASWGYWEADADFFSDVDMPERDWCAVTPDGRPVAARAAWCRERGSVPGGEIVPMTIRVRGSLYSPGESVSATEVTELSFEKAADGVTGFCFTTGVRAFERQFTIEAAASDGGWVPVVNRRTVAGSIDRDPRQPLTIYFDAPVDTSALRVSVSPAPGTVWDGETLEIASPAGLRTTREKTEFVPVRGEKNVRLADIRRSGDSTLMIFAASRQPVDMLSLATEARDFTIPFQLKTGSAADGPWLTAARGEFSCSESGIGNLEARFPERRSEYYLLEVPSSASEILSRSSFVWQGRRMLLIFEGAPAALTLYTGGRHEEIKNDGVIGGVDTDKLENTVSYLALKPEPNDLCVSSPAETGGTARGLMIIGGTFAVVAVFFSLALLRLKSLGVKTS